MTFSFQNVLIENYKILRNKRILLQGADKYVSSNVSSSNVIIDYSNIHNDNRFSVRIIHLPADRELLTCLFRHPT